MTTNVLLCSSTVDLAGLKKLFEKIAPDLTYHLWPDADPAIIDAAVCWYPEHGLLARLPRLKLVTSLAAGVDSILADPGLPDVPVCRVIDPNLAAGMAEFVIWGTLYYHRGFDAVVNGRTQREWLTPKQKAAADTTVGVMGMGVLGAYVARALAGLGFTVRGWSRSPSSTEGVTSFAGDGDRGGSGGIRDGNGNGNGGLPAFLSGLDVNVCLLPLTPQTEGILNETTFAQMNKGAAIINCGRGPHIDHDHLLAALVSGQLRGAVLDVFDKEPLPADSPLWADPRVLVTPHMASGARYPVMVQQVADNIRRMARGEPLLNTIDRSRGY